MPMKCPTEEEIATALAAEPSSPSRAGLLAHLDECDRCRQEVAVVGQVLFEGATSSRTLGEGQLLAARYRIEAFIDRGGMGEVYRARDTLLDEEVALKTLALPLLDDERAFGRFKAEVQTARRVVHANVCRVLESGLFHQAEDARGQGGERVPFLTMEFLRGETLARRLAQGGPLSDGALRDLLPQIVAGLRAIHAAGIVHRDLKSHNIFLVSSDAMAAQVKLMDFGLARPVNVASPRSFSSATALAGTPDYMAPEQLEGHMATPASDVYALGVVLFEMATGRLPFPGPTPLSAASKKLTQEAPRARVARVDLDPGWDELIAACLSRNPDDRPALADVVAPGELAARRGPRPGRAYLWAVAALLGAASAVSAAWLAGSDAGTPPAAFREDATVVRPAVRATPEPAVVSEEAVTAKAATAEILEPARRADPPARVRTRTGPDEARRTPPVMAPAPAPGKPVSVSETAPAPATIEPRGPVPEPPGPVPEPVPTSTSHETPNKLDAIFDPYSR